MIAILIITLLIITSISLLATTGFMVNIATHKNNQSQMETSSIEVFKNEIEFLFN